MLHTLLPVLQLDTICGIPQCKAISTCFQTNEILEVIIPDYGSVSLRDALHSALLDSPIKPRCCSECKTTSYGMQTTLFLELPKILIMRMRRFQVI
ncbi:hypothetical protein BKA70DRAFT_1429019 [Coprinopsis sp. MPI-PUGE-AT-0042]|nr:hypothetical protein BKA70DRAFT_1429019 [Coprinopsis sp. MPI-PUGE-AT-0042]